MDQVANLVQRPKLYNNIDGVGELGLGFMCLSYALLGWLQTRSPEHSVWNRQYTLFAFIGVMCAVIHYGSKAIKERITYPRTGWVQYSRRDTVWRPFFLGAAVAAAFSVAMSLALRRHWDLTTPGSLVGVLFALGYGFRIAGAIRWKWAIAGLMALGSVLIAVLPAPVVGAPASHSWVLRIASAKAAGAYLLNITMYGVLFLVSGVISFALYLRNTQPPASEEQ